ncbi:MAG: Uma2 family endonuclease [Gammaproteobacteria bacterium]|nr:Uma2 family endonuclease [Gammaproteobacteria bacterium]
MAIARKRNQLTEEEYLASELTSDIRREYIDGEIYAMSGAKMAHNRIVINVLRTLGNHLEGHPCEPIASDMKVRVEGNYFYPDVMVDCAELNDDASYTESPVLIVEVLSRSTRKTDKTLKMAAYKRIPTLKEYILIEQDFVDVEVVRRNQDWRSAHYFLGDEIYLESIDLSLSVEEIYVRVQNEDITEYFANKNLTTTGD